MKSNKKLPWKQGESFLFILICKLSLALGRVAPILGVGLESLLFFPDILCLWRPVFGVKLAFCAKLFRAFGLQQVG